MFDGDGVDFLSILPSSIDQTKASMEEKTFHVFDAKEVVDKFCEGLGVVNSKARGRGQTDSQKVVFRAKINGREMNIGEIELRTDPKNYGRVKFWLESKKVLSLLVDRIGETTEYSK